MAASIVVGYVKSSATYRFDDIVDSVQVTETVLMESLPLQHGVLVKFDSKQVGYGNRAGIVLTQMITHHVARVWVTQGEVSRAVMDDIGDMMTQTILR